MVKGAACGLGGALRKRSEASFWPEDLDPSEPEPRDPDPSEPEPSEPDPSDPDPREPEPNEPREPKDPKEPRDSDEPRDSEEPNPEEPNELEDSEAKDGPKELFPESDSVERGPEPDDPIWNISLGLMCFLCSASVKAEADGL